MCDVILTVREFVAHESWQTPTYKTYTRTKISMSTVQLMLFNVNSEENSLVQWNWFSDVTVGAFSDVREPISLHQAVCGMPATIRGRNAAWKNEDDIWIYISAMHRMVDIYYQSVVRWHFFYYLKI